MKGFSTTWPPNQVKIRKIVKKKKKINCPRKLKDKLPRPLKKKDGINSNKTERTKKITPINLLGIDRKIAYAKRKYHSGTIWVGVIIGLAKIKFSGSPKKNGKRKIKISPNEKKRKKNQKSFEVKNQWKDKRLNFLGKFKGLFLPDKWRKKRWRMINPLKINGRQKCIIKNRERVGALTANPPQTKKTNFSPTIGTAERRLVITVAPQKLICPQGRTYPIKAVIILKRKITTPKFQVSDRKNDPW